MVNEWVRKHEQCCQRIEELYKEWFTAMQAMDRDLHPADQKSEVEQKMQEELALFHFLNQHIAERTPLSPQAKLLWWQGMQKVSQRLDEMIEVSKNAQSRVKKHLESLRYEALCAPTGTIVDTLL